MAIDFSKRAKGQSRREYAAQILGGKPSDYGSNGKPKSGGGGGGGGTKKGGGYSSIAEAALKNTPGNQKTIDTFEEMNAKNPSLDAQDLSDSKAMFEPFYQNQIATQLEDLNTFTKAENVSYERTLRRGRASLAQSGGAIGGDRQNFDTETTADSETRKNNAKVGVEREIGTTKLNEAGFTSTGMKQEGRIIGQMAGDVAGQQQWFKNQRAQRYMGDSNTYYKQPSNNNIYGKPL